MKQWLKIAGLLVIAVFVPGGILIAGAGFSAMLLSRKKRGPDEEASVQAPQHQPPP